MFVTGLVSVLGFACNDEEKVKTREIPTFYVVWVLWEHIVRGYCAPVMVFVTMEVQLYLRLSQHQQRS